MEDLGLVTARSVNDNDVADGWVPGEFPGSDD